MTSTQVETAQGWTADDSTFGARLALIRQKMGWGNVKQAAEECGLPVQSWRTWERDGVTPRSIVSIALAIADRTGCDYGWLLTGPRLREGRVLVTAQVPSGTNQRSGTAARRLRRGSSRTNAKPRTRNIRPIGRPETGTAAPGPAGSPSQRRPSLVIHRPRD